LGKRVANYNREKRRQPAKEPEKLECVEQIDDDKKADKSPVFRTPTKKQDMMYDY